MKQLQKWQQTLVTGSQSISSLTINMRHSSTSSKCSNFVALCAVVVHQRVGDLDRPIFLLLISSACAPASYACLATYNLPFMICRL